jgi:hypothetical protein
MFNFATLCRPSLSIHRRFGSLDGILASRTDLKQYGAAHKLLGLNQPGADARCAAAAANAAVLRMQPQQQLQQLPQQQLQECYSQEVLRLRKHQVQGQTQPGITPGEKHQQEQHNVLRQQPMQQPQQQSLALLHPARQLHMQQCQPYLANLQKCLTSLGLTQQHPNWTSASGLWCDLLVQLPGIDTAVDPAATREIGNSSSSSSSAIQGSRSGSGGSSSAEAGGAQGSLYGAAGSLSKGQFVIFQLLGPADLSSGTGSCWLAAAGKLLAAPAMHTTALLVH